MESIECAHGPVAQLGERRVRNAEVESSILFGSTKWLKTNIYYLAAALPQWCSSVLKEKRADKVLCLACSFRIILPFRGFIAVYTTFRRL